MDWQTELALIGRLEQGGKSCEQIADILAGQGHNQLTPEQVLVFAKKFRRQRLESWRRSGRPANISVPGVPVLGDTHET